MTSHPALRELAETLRNSHGFKAKADIAAAAAQLGITGAAPVTLGDDCAAIADGDGYLLFAIEGFMNEFVAADPWFAGWCGVMVNISDIASMGGRPIAVVDAIWADGQDAASPVLAGLRAAAGTYGVPVAGGHSNLRNPHGQLAVAILGRASKLLTSSDAQPGDRLIAAVDLRGAYRAPFMNWNSATEASPVRLRNDLELLPAIAEAGLAKAGKDISQGGLIGTAAMLAECSGAGITIDVTAVPKPPGVPLDRWLQSFPSFGYLLAVAPENVSAVLQRFTQRDIAAAAIGTVQPGSRVVIADGQARATIWDFAEQPLTGFGPARVPANA